MSAADLFREGKLNEAVEAAIAAVKQKPTDLDARYTLAQMLCFAGDLERADTHLDAIASQDKERLIVIGMIRHLTRAEQWRRQFFDEGRVPEIIAEPTPVVRLHLEAAIYARKGETTQAVDLIRRADEQHTPLAGTCDGTPFDDLRDLDDLLGPVCEVLTSNGKYFWIPWERIERMAMCSFPRCTSIRTRKPTRPCGWAAALTGAAKSKRSSAASASGCCSSVRKTSRSSIFRRSSSRGRDMWLSGLI
jgi:protein involved in temperature-dependent protein secretion